MVNLEGTSLVGYATTTYTALCDALGQPTGDGDGYKVDVEWAIALPDGSPCSVYNWKNGPGYESGTEVDEITAWNIGGHGPDAVDQLRRLLPDARLRKL